MRPPHREQSVLTVAGPRNHTSLDSLNVFARLCRVAGASPEWLQHGDTARLEILRKTIIVDNIDLENPATCLKTASRARPRTTLFFKCRVELARAAQSARNVAVRH
jgi:hypothetical protein